MSGQGFWREASASQHFPNSSKLQEPSSKFIPDRCTCCYDSHSLLICIPIGICVTHQMNCLNIKSIAEKALLLSNSLITVCLNDILSLYLPLSTVFPFSNL